MVNKVKDIESERQQEEYTEILSKEVMRQNAEQLCHWIDDTHNQYTFTAIEVGTMIAGATTAVCAGCLEPETAIKVAIMGMCVLIAAIISTIGIFSYDGLTRKYVWSSKVDGDYLSSEVVDLVISAYTNWCGSWLMMALGSPMVAMFIACVVTREGWYKFIWLGALGICIIGLGVKQRKKYIKLLGEMESVGLKRREAYKNAK